MALPTPARTLVHVVALAVLATCYSASLQAETQLKNICRLKGQEENKLHGFGLVVGLNGTGEPGDRPTMQAMARAMELMGSPIGKNGILDDAAVAELKKIKNAVLVIVTATVPATGARRGEKLDCTVSAINGKSLVGGQLAFAALQGPNPRDPRVYALCSGTVHVESSAVPTVGRVIGGCQMEQDVYTPFYLQKEDGMYITLVVDKDHASFPLANDIAEKIRDNYGNYYTEGKTQTKTTNMLDLEGNRNEYVLAKDPTNIIVRIPKEYEPFPVQFAAEILDLRVNEEDPEARVDINLSTNTITISGDVRIGDVVVMHQNIIVEAEGVTVTELNDSSTKNPSLDRLVGQLRQLKVSERDAIEIIRSIHRLGKLHAKLNVK